MGSSRPTTVARTCSRIFRRSTCPASRPSKKVRKSASTWSRDRRASRLRISRKAAEPAYSQLKKPPEEGGFFVSARFARLAGVPGLDRFLQLLVAIQVPRTLAGVDLVEGLELGIEPFGEIPVPRVGSLV